MAYYVSSFSFDPESKDVYNNTLECRKVHDYFHQSSGGELMGTLRKDLTDDKFKRIIKRIKDKVRSIEDGEKESKQS